MGLTQSWRGSARCHPAHRGRCGLLPVSTAGETAAFQFRAHMVSPMARNTRLQPLAALRAPRRRRPWNPVWHSVHALADLQSRWRHDQPRGFKDSARSPSPGCGRLAEGPPEPTEKLVGRRRAKASVEDGMGAEASPRAHRLLPTAGSSAPLHATRQETAAAHQRPRRVDL